MNTFFISIFSFGLANCRSVPKATANFNKKMAIIFQNKSESFIPDETLTIKNVSESIEFTDSQKVELNEIIKEIKPLTVSNIMIESNINLKIEFKAEELDLIQKAQTNFIVKSLKVFYYWLTNPLLTNPSRNILKLNYSLLCKEKYFRFNFQSTGGLVYNGVPIDIFKIAILLSILDRAGFTNLESFSALLILNFVLIEVFSDGLFREPKLDTSPFNQFKIQLQKDLHQVEKVCNLEKLTQ